MREILFKAKRTSNARWIGGYFFKDGEKNCYIQQGDTALYYLVHPVTVCEFTGFYDTSVRRIFESDILRVWHSESQKISPTSLCISVSLLEVGLLSA